MTNEAINTAFNVFSNHLSLNSGEKYKKALMYMRDAALEKLANQDFARGETLVFAGESKFQVIVTDGEPVNELSFCGTVILMGSSAWPVGHHSDRWIRSEFCRP